MEPAESDLILTKSNTKFYFFSVSAPDSTAQGLLKVGLDAGPQPKRIRQAPKMLSAPSAFPQSGFLRRQEIKNNNQLVKR